MKKLFKKKSNLLFILDVLKFTFSAFGGGQAHIGNIYHIFTDRRKYISYKQLSGLVAIAHSIPGPSATQILMGLAYFKGGFMLMILTFLIWTMPLILFMSLLAINYHYKLFDIMNIDRFVYVFPVIVGIILVACMRMYVKLEKNLLSYFILFGSFLTSIILREAYVFPLIIFASLIFSMLATKNTWDGKIVFKIMSHISVRQTIFFVGLLLLFAFIGNIINKTSPFSLPIRLLENFYRNGIYAFGGANVVFSLLFNEFVEIKSYLSSQDLLSAFAIQKILPGPALGFTSFIGSITLINHTHIWYSAFIGGGIGLLGINLPGIFLMAFILPVWKKIEKFVNYKNIIFGITATIIGFTLYSVVLIIETTGFQIIDYLIMLLTFLILYFTRLPPAILVIIAFAINFLV